MFENSTPCLAIVARYGVELLPLSASEVYLYWIPSRTITTTLRSSWCSLRVISNCSKSGIFLSGRKVWRLSEIIKLIIARKWQL